MKSRPWIWLILLQALLMSGIIAAVIISIRHAPQSVPLDTPPPVEAHGR